MKAISKMRFLLFAIMLSTVSCQQAGPPAEAPQTQKSVDKSTLIKQTVQSDGHPMALWKKEIDNPKGVILFIHGRTWSAVPDFDLQVDGEDLSLMDGMNEQGFTTYALDLRGYGETPRDNSEWNTPNKAAKDILNVLEWISGQHNDQKVHLFGWSMGSTLSLLAAYQDPSNMATLTLFGFWMDMDQDMPEDSEDLTLEKRVNTAEAAASDFITPGSISQKAIDAYVAKALETDPIRMDWRQANEYNQIDPGQITIPVLILQGEHDPIGPTDRQAKLFTQLKTADKSWVVISGGDHAAFLEKPRPHFIKAFTSFIDRFNP